MDTPLQEPTKLPAGMLPSFIALVFGAVAMGVSPIFVRMVSSEIGPFASAFWRMALALPALHVWAALERKNLPPSLVPIPRKSRFVYAIVAGLAFAADLFFWHLSILNTSVANATFFATLMPVFAIGITRLVLGRRVQRSDLMGIAVCLAGGGVLVGKTMSVNPENLKGDVYGIVTAFFFSIYFIAMSHARQSGMRTAEITFSQTLVTAAALLAAAIVDHFLRGSAVMPHSAAGVGWLVALALISQVGGQGLMTFSLGRLPTIFSSLVIFMEAIAAAVFGWLVLNEYVSGSQAIGGVLILLGIWIARPKSTAKA